MNLVRSALSTTLVLAAARGASSAFAVGRGGAAAARSRTTRTRQRHHLFNRLFGSSGSGSASQTDSKYPVMAEESVMSPKAHGTSEKPVQKNLRWNCDYETADRICNFK